MNAYKKFWMDTKGRTIRILLLASTVMLSTGAAHAVPWAAGEVCLDMPPVNHPISMAQTVANERCVQKKAADNERRDAWEQESQRRIAEGKRNPLHDVPSDPGECAAAAENVALSIEVSNLTLEKARMESATQMVESDKLFNVRTRFDLCPQPETQLIYRMAEEIRHPKASTSKSIIPAQ